MFSKKKTSELGLRNEEDIHIDQKRHITIILDDVRSMHNVGSAFRTCDAFAAEAIYLSGYTPTPPHRDIHKTALGATETVHWEHFPNVADAITKARENGCVVYAVEQAHESVQLHNVVWDNEKPVALVFGNEVDGVSEAALQHCDGCIEIPQWGSKHSLNISVCVGVVIWELINHARSHRLLEMLATS